MNVVDAIRERASQEPGAPALVAATSDGAATVSYADLVERVEVLAEQLRRDGVSPAARCGLLAKQGPEFVLHALAILRAGACLVPIPDDHTGAVLEGFAIRARLAHLVDVRGAERVSSGGPGGSVDGQDDAAFRALDPAYLRFTSGTTSARKGVILGHDRVLERLAAANRALEIGPSDRVLWLLPMAHHFVVSILLYLRYGAAILLPASSLARPVLELASRERATVLYASPYHYQLLSKDVSGTPLDAVRLAISTAEGLRPEIAERFEERFDRPLGQALGIIEVGLPVINRARPGKPGCLGQPLPDYEVWLRGDDGEPIAGPSSPEHTGEICVRGPGMLSAYLDPWLPAEQVLEPDGFRTGDQGYFDADGDLYLVGRRTNRINMAGMKFFSEEVEGVLDEMPGVARSRVRPRDHEHLGQIAVAEIVLEPDAQAPAKKAFLLWCRGRLAAYKIPREFRVVDELPLTETGKLGRSS